MKLRAPFCINDLSTEHILRSRVRFYEVLKQFNIPVPMHVIVDRSGPTPPVVIESEDYIEVDGVRLAKPFVEKVRRLGEAAEGRALLASLPHALSSCPPAACRRRGPQRVHLL